ncbi:1782_t:CDS:2, partial [Cetraspora pellucida]
MDNLLVPSDTIDTTHATIESYAAQMKSVIILEKTKKNSNNSYKQILFVCEKQGQYARKNDAYTTKCTGYPFFINIYYRKHDKEFAITKSCLKHNYDPCSDATKFSSVMKKIDQNDLGLIEKLHNDGLRMKNIFSVLNSVSTKYLHKHDVYNAISDIALKNAFNDKQDQDDEFIQTIFWAYYNAVSEFAVDKDVLIIDTTYKTNSDLSEGKTEQDIIALWTKYPKAKIYISETWMLYKKSWLAPYTKRNINLDIRSSQHVKSLYTYEPFLHQNKHTYDEANMWLEKLQSAYSHFAFESFIKQQAELVKQLLSYHHSAFTGLMQQSYEYVIKHDKMPELPQRGSNIIQPSIFETVNISDVTNYNKIKIPPIKHSHRCLPNNRHIYNTDKNKTSLKKSISATKHLRGRSPKNAK